MTSADALIQLVPPPAGVAVEVDWTAFEERLGERLPGDYKWLVERYGPGKFDDFLHVYQPFAPTRHVRLADASARAAEILDHLRAGGRETIPYRTEELLEVAGTDNGDSIYWVRKPADDPDSWTITGNAARNTVWPVFEGGLVDFLHATLAGTHHMRIFPRNFPSESPGFRPYPPRGTRRR